MNARRLRAVARKEFIHVIRDWRSLFMAVAIPAVLILLFGYALDMDLKNVPTVVWDRSDSPESRELLSRFHGSPYFSIINMYDRYGPIEDDLMNGRAVVAVVIPRDFADKLQAGEKTAVQVLLDGSDANTAGLALGYVNGLSMMYNINLGAELAESRGMGALQPPVNMKPRTWYNQSMKSRNNLIPGIIAIVLMVIAAMLTSVTVAREWETGTMEQLISTPVRPAELVFGKVVPYFVIGMADTALAVILSQVLFDMPLRGSPGLLFAMAALFLTGALFFGLTLSIVLKTQVLANQIALLAGYMPSLLLSGFVFAIDNMPTAIQYITYIVPARYFVALLQGIYLKGVGLEILWLNAVLLGVYALLMIVRANKSMKTKLE